MPDIKDGRHTSNATDFDVVCECGAIYHTSEQHIGSYVNCARSNCGRKVLIRRVSDVALERGPVTPRAKTPRASTPAASDKVSTGSVTSSTVTGSLRLISAVSLLLAVALLLSKLLLMGASHFSWYLPNRRFLYRNLNAGILISVAFAAASGLLLYIARYKSALVDRQSWLQRKASIAIGTVNSVLRRVPFSWKLISGLVVVGIVVAVVVLGLAIRHTHVARSENSEISHEDSESRDVDFQPEKEKLGVQPVTPPVAETQDMKVVPESAVHWDDEGVVAPTLSARRYITQNKRSRSRFSEETDLGVDLAISDRAQIWLMDAPSATAKRLLLINAGDLVALMEREPRNGWFNVIHVRSGKEGWVGVDDVRVSYTQHRLPPPKFSEEYVGNDKDPTITVFNKTDRVLALRVGEAIYTLAGGDSLPISSPPGIWKFQASAPNVIPLSGMKEWKRGYRYEWTFWIKTTSVPILGVARHP